MSENQSETRREVPLGPWSAGNQVRPLEQWIRDSGVADAVANGPRLDTTGDPFSFLDQAIGPAMEPPAPSTARGVIRRALRRPEPSQEPQKGFDVDGLSEEQFAELQAAVDERSDRELAEAARRLGLSWEVEDE